ncbi:ATP-binding protein [Streptomyces sp. NPDC053560]|uniref:ATP-binding protein n=1 Tax=Streptomyces sp. NPDC053560 TaxID=3365711 RepID=UPI0037CE7E27
MPANVLDLTFEAATDLAGLRHRVRQCAMEMGLTPHRTSDFILAVNEIAANAIVHGGGKARIILTHTGTGLRCVIADKGPGAAGSAQGADPFDKDGAEHGRGLWVARALADWFDVVACDAGTTVTLETLLDEPL